MEQVTEPLNTRTDWDRRFIADNLRHYTKMDRERRLPLRRLHEFCRRLRLVAADIHVEPPAWIRRRIVLKQGKRVYDRYGRLMYMEKDRTKTTRIPASEFSPLVRFDPVFPMHPDPLSATPEERDERMAAFLNMYAASGLPTPSAEAVGVSYMQLLIWLNEDELWQARFKVAREAAKMVMEDVGRMRAMQGDSSLMTFFLKHDNPEMYGRTARKQDDGALPEGVSSGAVADALSVINTARKELPAERIIPPVLGGTMREAERAERAEEKRLAGQRDTDSPSFSPRSFVLDEERGG